MNISRDAYTGLDWSLSEAFVRVADAASLTRAAAALRVSQPTLSRQIHALEERLAVPLFVRHARGVAVTDRGAELLVAARAVDAQVDSFLRRVTGLRDEPAGTVRVMAAEPIAAHVLPAAASRIRTEHPKIAIELVVDNAAASLSRREADIAIRMFRPRQLDLVAKRLGAIRLGLYASHAYVDRCGAPSGLADIGAHTVIGMDRDGQWHETIRGLGLEPGQFMLRTDSILAQIEAVLAGVGIGGLHTAVARRHDLVPVLTELALDPLDTWLVVHEDVRGDPAVRAVSGALDETLRAYIAEGSE